MASVASNAAGDDRIDVLIQAQRPGCALDQALYADPAVFRRDRECVFSNHWILAGHVSQIPEPGDYLLFDLAGESIILIRDRQGAVHAHYNVCRHRGSRQRFGTSLPPRISGAVMEASPSFERSDKSCCESIPR